MIHNFMFSTYVIRIRVDDSALSLTKMDSMEDCRVGQLIELSAEEQLNAPA